MVVKLLQKIANHSFVILICIIIIFPIFWMFSTSVTSPEELFTRGLRPMPKSPTPNNYIEVLTKVPFFSWLKNSFITTSGILFLRVITSILAAYGFAHFEFRGKIILFYMVIGTLMVPFAITMVPNYILISNLNMLNTQAGVILPHMANAFGIFYIRQHIKSLPQSLFESAYMDGATSWQILWHIIVPLIKGPISAITILLGIEAWNIFLWPMLILTKTDMYTIPVGLKYFQDQEKGIMWGQLMAVASMASIPALFIYILARKQIMKAHISSGIKG